jgi:hypothetical protein
VSGVLSVQDFPVDSKQKKGNSVSSVVTTPEIGAAKPQFWSYFARVKRDFSMRRARVLEERIQSTFESWQAEIEGSWKRLKVSICYPINGNVDPAKFTSVTNPTGQLVGS